MAERIEDIPSGVEVAQMDAVGRLGVAIRRIAAHEAEIERLRAALEVLSSDFNHAWAANTLGQTIRNAEKIARNALEQSARSKEVT
jgi:hypothetical protein